MATAHKTVTLTSAPAGVRRLRVGEHTFLLDVPVSDVPEQVVKDLEKREGFKFDTNNKSSGSSGGSDS